jgi:hypothetical protein
LSTKIHLMVDALGNPLAFFLTGGQAHDLQAPVLSAPASPELRESWVGTQSPTLIDGNSSPPVSHQAFAAVANVSLSRFSTVGEREHPAEGVAPMMTSRRAHHFRAGPEHECRRPRNRRSVWPRGRAQLSEE